MTMNDIAGRTILITGEQVIQRLKDKAAKALDIDNDFVNKLKDFAASPAESLKDSLNISQDSLDRYERSQSVIRDIEAGLSDIRQKDIEFARAQLGAIRKQLAITAPLGAASGKGGAFQNSILGQLDGIAANVRGIARTL